MRRSKHYRRFVKKRSCGPTFFGRRKLFSISPGQNVHKDRLQTFDDEEINKREYQEKFSDHENSPKKFVNFDSSCTSLFTTKLSAEYIFFPRTVKFLR